MSDKTDSMRAKLKSIGGPISRDRGHEPQVTVKDVQRKQELSRTWDRP